MAQDYPSEVRKWDIFEVKLEGTSEGNPFKEQKVTGLFTSENESAQIQGFYDGNGIYRVRFMPSFEGKYNFVLRSSFMDETLSGTFFVRPAELENHGPVRTANTYHFAYEDGTSFYPVGTTAYAWALQDDASVQQTLESLDEAYFNKMRFCVFPKHYIYNFKEPREYPYVGTPMDSSILNEDNFMQYSGKAEGNHFDYECFNPSYFQHLDYCIAQLAKRGIEADLILFHPYDRWGFSCMTSEEDELYLRYMINRYSAYHNVWWAMANEWDLMKTKSIQDWENLASILVRKDPYHHLRSIHNCREMYDHSRPWITHCSIQRVDLYKGAELTDEIRERYQKPVFMDEIGYEGDLPLGWGNLTAQEMTRRFWETAIRGGYPGHGETYLNEEQKIWWSHGGLLHGDSWKRVGFLLDILHEVPGNGLASFPIEWDGVTGVPETEWYEPIKSQYIFYYSFMRPSYRDYHIDDSTSFLAETIDTWGMVKTKIGIFKGKFRVPLTGRQYMAVRLTKVEDVIEEKIDEVQSEPVIEEEEHSVFEPPFEESKEEAVPAEEVETVETKQEYVEAVQAEESPEVAEEDTSEEELTADESEQEVIEGGADESELPDIAIQPDLLSEREKRTAENKPKYFEEEEKSEDGEMTDTLNIPPVDFTHSIDEDPKN